MNRARRDEGGGRRSAALPRIAATPDALPVRDALTLPAVADKLVDALEHLNVPSYLIDTAGVVRWLNPAARHLVGDVAGRQFTSVVVPGETLRARELFSRKVLGRAEVTDAAISLLTDGGGRLAVDISSVPLIHGDHVVGIFGQASDVREPVFDHPELHLTPRQTEILHLLELGRSTTQIAEELHLSRETVRNHIRHLLRALGANSRLQAVALARGSTRAD